MKVHVKRPVLLGAAGEIEVEREVTSDWLLV